MKKIQFLTRTEVIKFHVLFGAALGIKFIWDPGFLQKLYRKLLDRIVGKLAYLLPDKVFGLRPMCFKNIVFLTLAPGDPRVSYYSQIETAIHEAIHSLRIRAYPGKVSQWYFEYFSNDKFRALEETSSQVGEAQFQYWNEGTVPCLGLENYLCGSVAKNIAQKDYDREIEAMKKHGRGTGTTKAVCTAIRILKEML